MKNRGVARLLAITLVAIFFTNQCVFAHLHELSLWKKRPAEPKKTQFISPFPLVQPVLPQQIKKEIPEKIITDLAPLLNELTSHEGTVRNISLPKLFHKNKVILHIQDIHMNHEAQRNIARTIQKLVQSNQINLIALEGSFGPIDFLGFRHFPSQDIVRTVADYLLKKHEISGPIHTALTSRNTMPKIIGIDDKAHYDANVDAYRLSSQVLDKVKEHLLKEQQGLEKEKYKLFNSELINFDLQVKAYHQKYLSIGAYVQFLAKHKVSLSPEVKIFLEALALESVFNFSAVEMERSHLLKVLLPKLTVGESTHLTNTSLASRMGHLRSVDFYSYLKDLCQKKNIALSQFPAMSSYVRYILLSDSIDMDKVLNSIKEMENNIYAALAKTPEQKRLVQKSKYFYLTKKLVDFSLTKEEWGEYKLMEPSPSPLPHSGRGINISPFENFYKQAEIRDEKMAEKLLKTVLSQTNDVLSPQFQKPSTPLISVLVTGGFHSAGIDQRLVNAGYTVIQFTPKLTKVNSKNGTAYLSVFAQEKTPLETLLEGEKLFLARSPTHGVFSGAGAIAAIANEPNHIHDLLPQYTGKIKLRPLDDSTNGTKNTAVVFASKDKKDKATVHVSWHNRGSLLVVDKITDAVFKKPDQEFERIFDFWNFIKNHPYSKRPIEKIIQITGVMLGTSTVLLVQASAPFFLVKVLPSFFYAPIFYWSLVSIIYVFIRFSISPRWKASWRAKIFLAQFYLPSYLIHSFVTALFLFTNFCLRHMGINIRLLPLVLAEDPEDDETLLNEAFDELMKPHIGKRASYDATSSLESIYNLKSSLLKEHILFLALSHPSSDIRLMAAEFIQGLEHEIAFEKWVEQFKSPLLPSQPDPRFSGRGDPQISRLNARAAILFGLDRIYYYNMDLIYEILNDDAKKWNPETEKTLLALAENEKCPLGIPENLSMLEGLFLFSRWREKHIVNADSGNYKYVKLAIDTIKWHSPTATEVFTPILFPVIAKKGPLTPDDLYSFLLEQLASEFSTIPPKDRSAAALLNLLPPEEIDDRLVSLENTLKIIIAKNKRTIREIIALSDITDEEKDFLVACLASPAGGGEEGVTDDPIQVLSVLLDKREEIVQALFNKAVSKYQDDENLEINITLRNKRIIKIASNFLKEEWLLSFIGEKDRQMLQTWPVIFGTRSLNILEHYLYLLDDAQFESSLKNLGSNGDAELLRILTGAVDFIFFEWISAFSKEMQLKNRASEINKIAPLLEKFQSGVDTVASLPVLSNSYFTMDVRELINFEREAISFIPGYPEASGPATALHVLWALRFHSGSSPDDERTFNSIDYGVLALCLNELMPKLLLPNPDNDLLEKVLIMVLADPYVMLNPSKLQSIARFWKAPGEPAPILTGDDLNKYTVLINQMRPILLDYIEKNSLVDIMPDQLWPYATSVPFSADFFYISRLAVLLDSKVKGFLFENRFHKEKKSELNEITSTENWLSFINKIAEILIPKIHPSADAFYAPPDKLWIRLKIREMARLLKVKPLSEMKSITESEGLLELTIKYSAVPVGDRSANALLNLLISEESDGQFLSLKKALKIIIEQNIRTISEIRAIPGLTDDEKDFLVACLASPAGGSGVDDWRQVEILLDNAIQTLAGSYTSEEILNNAIDLVLRSPSSKKRNQAIFFALSHPVTDVRKKVGRSIKILTDIPIERWIEQFQTPDIPDEADPRILNKRGREIEKRISRSNVRATILWGIMELYGSPRQHLNEILNDGINELNTENKIRLLKMARDSIEFPLGIPEEISLVEAMFLFLEWYDDQKPSSANEIVIYMYVFHAIEKIREKADPQIDRVLSVSPEQSIPDPNTLAYFMVRLGWLDRVGGERHAEKIGAVGMIAEMGILFGLIKGALWINRALETHVIGVIFIFAFLIALSFVHARLYRSLINKQRRSRGEPELTVWDAVVVRSIIRHLIFFSTYLLPFLASSPVELQFSFAVAFFVHALYDLYMLMRDKKNSVDKSKTFLERLARIVLISVVGLVFILLFLTGIELTTGTHLWSAYKTTMIAGGPLAKAYAIVIAMFFGVTARLMGLYLSGSPAQQTLLKDGLFFAIFLGLWLPFYGFSVDGLIRWTAEIMGGREASVMLLRTAVYTASVMALATIYEMFEAPIKQRRQARRLEKQGQNQKAAEMRREATMRVHGRKVVDGIFGRLGFVFVSIDVVLHWAAPGTQVLMAWVLGYVSTVHRAMVSYTVQDEVHSQAISRRLGLFALGAAVVSSIASFMLVSFLSGLVAIGLGLIGYIYFRLKKPKTSKELQENTVKPEEDTIPVDDKSVEKIFGNAEVLIKYFNENFPRFSQEEFMGDFYRQAIMLTREKKEKLIWTLLKVMDAINLDPPKNEEARVWISWVIGRLLLSTNISFDDLPLNLFKPRRIDLREATPNVAAGLAGGILESLPPLNLNPPLDFPDLKTVPHIEPINVETVAHFSGFLIEDAIITQRLPRTVVFEDKKSGKRLAMKLIRNKKGDLQEVFNEAAIWHWTHQTTPGTDQSNKTHYKFRSDYPRSLINSKGEPTLYRVDPENLPLTAREFILEMNKQFGLASENGQLIAFIYIIENEDYFISVNDSKVSSQQAWKIMEKTLFDLGRWASLGIFHKALIDMLHTEIEEDDPEPRDLPRRFMWMIALVYPSFQFMTGMAQDLSESLERGNVRVSGVADGADFITLDSLIRDIQKEFTVLTPLGRFRERAAQFYTVNFLGEYLFTLLFAVALHVQKGEIRQSVEEVERFSVAASQLGEGFTGQPMKLMMEWILKTGNIDGIFRQLSFFMTDEKKSYLLGSGRSFPEDVFGEDSQVIFQHFPWLEKHLGYPNGSFPIQMMISFTYLFLTQLILNKVKGVPLRTGTEHGTEHVEKKRDNEGMRAGAVWVGSIGADLVKGNVNALLGAPEMMGLESGQLTEPNQEKEIIAQLEEWMAIPEFQAMVEIELNKNLSEDDRQKINAKKMVELFTALVLAKSQRPINTDQKKAADLKDTHLLIIKSPKEMGKTELRALVMTRLIQMGLSPSTSIVADSQTLKEIPYVIETLKSYGLLQNEIQFKIGELTITGPILDEAELNKMREKYNGPSLIFIDGISTKEKTPGIIVFPPITKTNIKNIGEFLLRVLTQV
ncbi:MAG: hypothetical protein ACKVQC_07840 [Elusimicrobiota bacterium]